MAPLPDLPLMDDDGPKDAKVDFPSTWNAVADTSTTPMQTDPIMSDDKEMQTKMFLTVSTQIDVIPQGGASKADMIDLSQFARMGKLITAEMERARMEQGMLDPFSRAGQHVEEQAVLAHTLTLFADPSTIASASSNTTRLNKNKLTVTSLSWSSTGQSIAASFGRYDIVGWCNHPGALAIWNMGRQEVNETKPDVLVDIDNCLQICAFHPAHPALIAGGTFNGELYIWDLSQDGDLQRGKSDGLSDARHTEPITAIEWQYSMTEKAKYGVNEKAYRVVTLSSDGRVLVWLWHKLDNPVYGYILLWPQPQGHKVLWGGSCMSFQHDQLNARAEACTFVVGTEGGKIFKCFFDMNDVSSKEFHRVVTAGEKLDLRVPIKDTDYHAHAGAIYGIECSPFQRDLFITCGADSTVRIYSLLKNQSLMTMEPANTYLYQVKWSPSRPLVFATSAGDGRVYMYDLLSQRDIVQPVMVLEVNHSNDPVYSLAFNPKKPNLLATADFNGIQIWELPPSMVELNRGEDMLIKKMAASDDSNGKRLHLA